MKENSKVTDINVGDMEENIKELKRLLYRDELTQYGKRKLINYYEQQEKDYKRVLEMNEVLLKENELLRKDIEGWKKYCEEIEKDQTEMSNKNCELEFEVEKLQKENEEWQRAYQEEKDEQFDFINKISSNDSIPIQKIKDKIEKYKKLSDKFYVKFLESDRYNTDIREKGIKCDAIILALEELIEEREEE